MLKIKTNVSGNKLKYELINVYDSELDTILVSLKSQSEDYVTTATIRYKGDTIVLAGTPRDEAIEAVEKYLGKTIFETSDGDIAIPVKENYNYGNGDVIQFIRKDGIRINYSESRLVRSTIREADCCKFIVDGFEFKKLDFESAYAGLRYFNGANEMLLTLILSKPHDYIENREGNVIASYTNDSYSAGLPGDERGTGLFCVGSYVLDYDTFLYQITDSGLVLKNYLVDIFYDKSGENESTGNLLHAIIPCDEDGYDDRSRIFIRGDIELLNDIAENPNLYTFYGRDERFFRPGRYNGELTLTEGTTINWRTGDVRVSVPIVETFDSAMIQEDAVSEFVEEKLSDVVNRIVDYEKRQFIPVRGDIDIREIDFKIHLRGRYIYTETGRTLDTVEWKTSDSELWFNGTASTKGDSIRYMGFDEDDIYYRKRRVRETFLRVSIYNSPDRRVQKLLYTAKIYLNANGLYGKYVENVNDESVVDKLTNIETEFICTHKYDYDNSTEGFYMHLFPSNLGDDREATVYMKCELNNAKYGQVVPFVCFSNDVVKNGYLKRNNEGMLNVDMKELYEDMYIPIVIRRNSAKNRYEWETLMGGVSEGILTLQLYEPRINGVSDNGNV